MSDRPEDEPPDDNGHGPVRGALSWLILLLLAGGLIWWEWAGPTASRSGSAPTPLLLLPTVTPETTPSTPESTPNATEAIPTAPPSPSLTPTAPAPTTSPAPVATPSPIPTPLAESAVHVANTGGEGLNLRAGPGTDQPTLAGLPDGAPLVQIGSPVSADGLLWVNVRDGAGQVGWVAQEYIAP